MIRCLTFPVKAFFPFVPPTGDDAGQPDRGLGGVASHEDEEVKPFLLFFPTLLPSLPPRAGHAVGVVRREQLGGGGGGGQAPGPTNVIL